MTGYESKKKAAQDKLDNDDLTIAYQSGYYDGKKAAQEPNWAWATKEDFYRELDRRVERMRKEMEIKTVTMRCKDYDVALNIVDMYGGHVVVGQVSFPPQPAQEPSYWLGYGLQAHTEKPFNDATPLYTAPPQRPWVGLTAEEAAECWTTSATQTWKNFEAKLKEKNT